MATDKLLACRALLIKRQLSIAFAESATAGRLTSDFSLVLDAGKFLKGGFVCYHICLKEETLGVPKDLIEKYTRESAEVTAAIAKGPSRYSSRHYRPYCARGSETKEKPVGTMFIVGFIKNGTIEIFSDR
ncbi:MAG: CinA family protein [Bacteroidota bacterium]